MTDELKPCPFCGGYLGMTSAITYRHPKGKCILAGHSFPKGHIGQWNAIRALPAADAGALGAVVMRDAAADIVDGAWHYDPDERRQVNHDVGETADLIRAIPLPTHAAQLAAALALPEVAALVEAAKEQAKLHRVLKSHGIAADTCDRDLRTALAALEARHD